MNMSDLDFFKARAKQCRDEARNTILQNVRDRCERAEEAWNELIARHERHAHREAASAQRKAEAGEAAEMLRARASECRELADRSRTLAARQAYRTLAAQLEEQAKHMVP